MHGGGKLAKGDDARAGMSSANAPHGRRPVGVGIRRRAKVMEQRAERALVRTDGVEELREMRADSEGARRRDQLRKRELHRILDT